MLGIYVHGLSLRTDVTQKRRFHPECLQFAREVVPGRWEPSELPKGPDGLTKNLP
jgi:hypothetical protein